ncbi:hypothetical protein PGT21_029583 [Puccinia graminis f. sp. tritici]|uniref:Uncharacterized protein n=1 Tax=Puccinia graminis f. sp. tritici TaxID=56615 RepID=A0A5B0ME22_PUCGR|nr:hypothetical protein PGT21_029583 [Puccinia graminis f. sp. tritici]
MPAPAFDDASIGSAASSSSHRSMPGSPQCPRQLKTVSDLVWIPRYFLDVIGFCACATNMIDELFGSDSKDLLCAVGFCVPGNTA